MRPKLNGRKTVIARFITDYFERCDRLPSEKDIVDATGIPAGSVHRYLAEMRENGEMRFISRRLPENMVSEDELVSPQTMAEFLKQVRQEERIKTKDCIMVLAESNAFFRHVSLPPMSEEELRINLPYEFRDFIEGDPEEWVFDYAVDEMVYGQDQETGEPTERVEQMELFASACRASLVDERAEILKRAGFTLRVVMPAPMAYTRLLLDYHTRYPMFGNTSTVFVDIGYTNTSVLLFSGSKFQALRTIDLGCIEIDQTIAELLNVDRHTAASYKYTNFHGVLDLPEVISIYDRLGLEVNRIVNFYNFSNPDANIQHMMLLGGGAQINQLVDNMVESFDLPVQRVSAMFSSDARDNEIAPSCALSYAGLMEGEAIE